MVPLDGPRVTFEHCLELMPLLDGMWKVTATDVCTIDDVAIAGTLDVFLFGL